MILLAVVPLFVVLPFLFRSPTVYTSARSRPNFDPVKPQLTLVETRHEYIPRPEDPRGFHTTYEHTYVWVYGTIKNESKKAWDNLEFVFEFKDAQGNRIDLSNVTLRQTVEPHSTLEFRLRVEINKTPEIVASVEGKVTSAHIPYGR